MLAIAENLSPTRPSRSICVRERRRRWAEWLVGLLASTAGGALIGRAGRLAEAGAGQWAGAAACAFLDTTPDGSCMRSSSRPHISRAGFERLAVRRNMFLKTMHHLLGAVFAFVFSSGRECVCVCSSSTPRRLCM